MAETILTGEKIEEFPLRNRFCTTTDFLAIFSWFSENLLMGYCPSDAGNGNRNDEKVQYLG